MRRNEASWNKKVLTKIGGKMKQALFLRLVKPPSALTEELLRI